MTERTGADDEGGLALDQQRPISAVVERGGEQIPLFGG